MTEPAATPSGVRLTARLPKQASHNGLAAQVGDLYDNPHRLRTAIIVYDVGRRIEDMDDDNVTSVVRLLRIEPLAGAAEKTAQKLLAQAATARTGDQLALSDFDHWARPTDVDDPGFDDDEDGAGQ